jgi:chemotaxis protein methyltransferase CheR
MMDGATPDLTPKVFKLFQEYINENCGIYIDDYRADALRVSLWIRMRDLGYSDYIAYLSFLRDGKKGDDEFKELLNLITINETCFFRNPNQFAALAKYVIPEIIKRKKKTDRTIRIWSAGCSTGEEPYSIAMVLLDRLPDAKSWRIDILGTDVSRQALSRAQRGCYGERTMREMDEAYIKRYFKQNDLGEYCLSDKIKKMVSFGYHNLIKEPYPFLIMGGWDIIFCRNVTIYFRLPSVKRVVDNFYQSLNEGGYLFIGHAESLYQISDSFVPIELDSAFVYKKMPGKDVKEIKDVEEVKEVKDIEEVKEKKTGIKKKKPKTVEPEEEEKLFNEARLLFKEEDFEQAKVMLLNVLKLNPENHHARLLLGQVYANENLYDAAANEASKVLKADPLSVPAHFLLGVVCQKQERTDEAVKEFKRVVYLDSDFALGHLNLANIYRSQHLDKKALREYNNAVRSLVAKPHGDWLDFAGGFLSEVLVEVCRRNIGQIKKS